MNGKISINQLAKEFPWSMRQKFLQEAHKQRLPASVKDIEKIYHRLYIEWVNGQLERDKKEKARLALLKKMLSEI